MSEPQDRPGRPRKDRLIQTRVPRDLETTLKEEAQRRRLSVSHLIRSVLEDTFQLVDGVVADVDEIVSDSARLSRNVRRNAQRLVAPDRDRRGRAPSPLPAAAPTASADFPHVYAWNELVLNRAVHCSRCDAPIAPGERGFAGLSDEADGPPAWMCERCIAAL